MAVSEGIHLFICVFTLSHEGTMNGPENRAAQRSGAEIIKLITNHCLPPDSNHVKGFHVDLRSKEGETFSLAGLAKSNKDKC